jgi:hypothetical protein
MHKGFRDHGSFRVSCHFVPYLLLGVLKIVYSFKSVTIPQRDDPRHEKLAKRCESSRPMGMFRSSENEFLLCYDGKGTLAALSICRLTLSLRIWVVCEPAR